MKELDPKYFSWNNNLIEYWNNKQLFKMKDS